MKLLGLLAMVVGVITGGVAVKREHDGELTSRRFAGLMTVALMLLIGGLVQASHDKE